MVNWLIGGLLLAGYAYWHALARTLREDRAREERRVAIERQVREDCRAMRQWYLAKQGTTESVAHAIERVTQWRSE
jgi:low affinity Fe/Cu permease